MPEVKWIKITTDMFDDEKIRLIEKMPEGDTILVIWIKLLTLAGKINAGGYIMLTENIPYTEDMITTIIDRQNVTVKYAFETLERFEMISFPDGKLLINNWDLHQNAEALAKIREQTRLRVSNYRKRNISVTKTLPSYSLSLSNSTNNVNTIYGEFNNVTLSEKEYAKLLERFGEKETLERIERLSSGIASKGYKYKSHYATILNWKRRDDEKKPKTGDDGWSK